MVFRVRSVDWAISGFVLPSAASRSTSYSRRVNPNRDKAVERRDSSDTILGSTTRSPRRIRRSATETAIPAMSFSKPPSAPASSAFFMATWSVCAVKITIRAVVLACRILAMTSVAPMSGSRRSSRTMSGWSCRTSGIAARPDSTDAATTSMGSVRSSSFTPSRTTGWSSTTRTFLLFIMPGIEVLPTTSPDRYRDHGRNQLDVTVIDE